MKSNLTLGSLFDGSGGFPLGGLISGIIPVWASEIEPFPIRVTTKRLPQMKHYGDIAKMNGGEIEPVDIITFGSPCQDMSIAGKRRGLNGDRSSLFYEAIRIIKEMRCKTNGKYPRYIVWENVTGAFSSNKGEDFKSVLEEICKIKDPNINVPKPKKWHNAGNIVADNFSLAWRVFDSQFWGVPQRRKRIYLVADLDDKRAGEILFESEGLSRYSSQGFRSWQKAANCTGESSKETSRGSLIFENHGQDSRFKQLEDVAPTVLSTYGTGGNNQPFVVENHKCFDIRLTSEGTKNARANVYETQVSRTLDTGGTTPDRNQGGVAVVYAIDRESFNCGKNFARSPGININGINATLSTYGPTAVAHPVYSTSKSSHHTITEKELANTLVATDYKDPPIINDVQTASGKKVFGTLSASMGSKQWLGNQEAFSGDYHIVEPDYIVRRLTPTECARLQGFPDWWCSNLETENPTDEDITFWREVFETHRKIMGKSSKPKTDKQIIKWLKSPHSDSAEYKMWGNGVSLPVICFVLSGIVWSQKEQ